MVLSMLSLHQGSSYNYYLCCVSCNPTLPCMVCPPLVPAEPPACCFECICLIPPAFCTQSLCVHLCPSSLPCQGPAHCINCTRHCIEARPFAAPQALRDGPAYDSFLKRWKLSVYFSLRFQVSAFSKGPPNALWSWLLGTTVVTHFLKALPANLQVTAVAMLL